MKTRRLIWILLLTVVALAALLSPSSRMVAGSSSQVILIRINSGIDYKIADLVESAATDIENGNAAKLLIEINSDGGYYGPAMQIAQRLSSIHSQVVAYIGPSGAISSGFSVYLAMASGLLAMNTGAVIGAAASGVVDSGSANYLMNLMRSLATMNGRNAEAATRMVTDNIQYSADEAYSNGVCDLRVDSYDGLLSTLKIDPATVSERQATPDLKIDQQTGYQYLKLFADLTTLKYLFIAVTGLVVLNLVLAIARPKKSKVDETTLAMMNFIRTEMLAVELQRSLESTQFRDAPLQTIASTPSPPTFKISKVPTPTPSKRFERPIEVKKT